MKRVLIADEFDMLRSLVKAVLEDGGYEVIEAEDGEEALRVADEPRPDLILLDYKLAGTARTLRTLPHFYFIPILVLYPHRNDLDCFTPLSPFTNGTIDKSRIVSDLLDCVDTHLRFSAGHHKQVAQMEELSATVSELRERQEMLESKLEQSEVLIQVLLDAVSSHCSILGPNAEIVAVNLAWKRFAEANGADDATREGVGKNYFEVCRDAVGPNSEEAPEVALGLQAVIKTGLKQFTLEYPCHSPANKRWFMLDMRPLGKNGGVIIMHHWLRTE